MWKTPMGNPPGVKYGGFAGLTVLQISTPLALSMRASARFITRRILPCVFSIGVPRGDDPGVVGALGELQERIPGEVLRGDRVADDVGGDHPLVHTRARLHVLREEVRHHV